MNGAKRRFRPILLTSLTTFLGACTNDFGKVLAGSIFDSDGISLGFGVLFATGIILLIVPSLYMIVEDLKGVSSKSHEANDATQSSMVHGDIEATASK